VLTHTKSLDQTPQPEFNVAKREVEAYVSIFGNRDRVGDIVHKGAFQGCIGPDSRVSRGLVPVKHNHTLLVGTVTGASEDSTGLLTRQKYASDRESDRIFGLVRDRHIPTMSFKYLVPPGGSTRRVEHGEATNHLTELVLLEAGPADPDIAVNDETFVTSVKGLFEVSNSLSAMAQLCGSEEWAAQSLSSLTPEELESMKQMLSALPKVGETVRRLMFAAVEESDELGLDNDGDEAGEDECPGCLPGNKHCGDCESPMTCQGGQALSKHCECCPENDNDSDDLMMLAISPETSPVFTPADGSMIGSSYPVFSGLDPYKTLSNDDMNMFKLFLRSRRGRIFSQQH